MKRLKELRQEKELLQKDIAKIINVSAKAISQYERGERQPDFQTLKKMCDFFGVTADFLLGFEDY